ncbi:ABC-type cobalamin/Fe3+-siderophores transport system ATPase subunit [Paenibacillus sp. DS2015]
MSARYADHIFALHKGKLVAEGEASKVITGTLVKDIFGLDCSVIEDPISGSPMVLPIGRYHVNNEYTP